jgi:hypothetical protein
MLQGKASYAVVLVVAAVVVVGLYQTSSGIATRTTDARNATKSSDDTMAITTGPGLPCSAPGVECGSFQIASISLKADSTPSQSNLTLVLANTGNVRLGSFEVFFGNTTRDGSFLGPTAAGQNTTAVVMLTRATNPVVPGGKYTIWVEGFIIENNQISANLWQHATVVAR